MKLEINIDLNTRATQHPEEVSRLLDWIERQARLEHTSMLVWLPVKAQTLRDIDGHPVGFWRIYHGRNKP